MTKNFNTNETDEPFECSLNKRSVHIVGQYTTLSLLAHGFESRTEY